ncbi:MAG: hypothetical protein IJR67_02945 [Acholeplasmatales bacterium]|nr:hypothetical protein [Acholeplasmatales bacterium]
MRKLKKLLIIPVLGLLFLVSSCALFSDIQNAFNINGKTGTGSTPQSSQTTGSSGSTSSSSSSEGATSSVITGTEIIIDDSGNFDFTNINYNRLYGYSVLGTLTKASGLQKMYRSLFNDLQMALKSTSDYDATTRITYKYSDDLTENEATIVYSTLVDDNPQFCFLNSGFQTSSSSFPTTKTMILTISENYYTAASRQAIVTKLNNQYSAIKSYLNERHLLPIANLTDVQIAKGIHDYLCNNLTYAYSSGNIPESASWAHSIVGLLDYNKGVCECYAECYLLFSHAFGLNSILVSGVANGGAGSGNHAWNYTKIDDSYYLVDVTWDDQSTIRYNYFLAGSNSTTDHTPTATDFDNPSPGGVVTFQITLPELSQTDYSIL